MKTITTCFAMPLAIFSLASNSCADTFGSGANQFTIDFVTIGNPGNPPDTTGDPNPAGSVPYVYQIGKYEVSRDMIDKSNAAGSLGLSLHDLSFVTGGPRADMPVMGVSWNEAARSVNWLNTSQGISPAYKFSTQPGEVGYDPNANIDLWQASDPGFDATNQFRNNLAHYVLPSVDEWYKSAFYDPNANGAAGGYWNFPTGSDSIPTAVASGTDAGTAVSSQLIEQGPADITQAGGLSPYGTMAQAGNVWEWVETEVDLVNDDSSHSRGLRGSGWASDPKFWSASFGYAHDPSSGTFDGSEVPNFGFRVASVRTSNSPLPDADFNGDGAVDGADLAAWRLNFGVTSAALNEQGDADYDADVDGGDFLTWQQRLASRAATGTIPEPSTLVLLMLAEAGWRLRPGRASIQRRCPHKKS